MKSVIQEHEIIEILNNNYPEYLNLGVILKKLNEIRVRENKPMVKKTTLYNNLEKLVMEKSINHKSRKGYSSKIYKFEKANPYFKYYQIYKELIQERVHIMIKKDGSLDPKGLKLKFKKKFESFEKNYKMLKEQGIIEIQKYDLGIYSFLNINYDWAVNFNICVHCLDEINPELPFFKINMVRKGKIFPFAITHLACLGEFLEFPYLDVSHKKKKIESEKKSNSNQKKEKDLEQKKKGDSFLDDKCRHCGLPLDLYELFWDENGGLSYLYYEHYYKKKQLLNYQMTLSQELYGDVLTLSQSEQYIIRKSKLYIMKVVEREGKFYHPLCAKKINRKQQKSGGGDCE